MKENKKLFWVVGALVVVAVIVIAIVVGASQGNEVGDGGKDDSGVVAGEVDEPGTEKKDDEVVAEVPGGVADLPESGPRGVVGLAAVLGIAGYLGTLGVMTLRDKRVY